MRAAQITRAARRAARDVVGGDRDLAARKIAARRMARRVARGVLRDVLRGADADGLDFAPVAPLCGRDIS